MIEAEKAVLGRLMTAGAQVRVEVSSSPDGAHLSEHRAAHFHVFARAIAYDYREHSIDHRPQREKASFHYGKAGGLDCRR